MNLYRVKITETLEMIVEIEAEDECEAEQTASDNWNDGDYVIDGEHFMGATFEVIKDKE